MGEGEINKNKETRAKEGGGVDQARLFGEAGKMWWLYMKSCFYPLLCSTGNKTDRTHSL